MTKKLLTVSLVAGLVLAASVHAQTPVEKPADPPKVEAPKAEAKKPAVLSDVEKASIDVLSLIAQRDAALKDAARCSAELGPLQVQLRENQLRARVDALRQVIEGGHPGYRWDIEKGTLVAVPPKAASVAATKP